MVLTLLLGLTFLLTQVIEYHRLGFNTGNGSFAATFFGLTGLHACHVFIGLLILLAMTFAPSGAISARAPSRARGRRDLLALRRRDVDRGLRHRLHPLAGHALRDRSPQAPPTVFCKTGRYAKPVPQRGGGRFVSLLLVIGSSSASIAVASLINRWAGLAVFLLETGALLSWWVTTRGDAENDPVKQAPAAHPPGHKRAARGRQRDGRGRRAPRGAEAASARRQNRVLVVTTRTQLAAEALGLRRGWRSRPRPGKRLERSLEAMRAAGMSAPRRDR